MSTPDLSSVAKAMRDIDFAMLFTRSEGGEFAGRPMSNNRQVDFDGETFFFTDDSTKTVRDIERDANVGLSYQSSKGLLGGTPVFISMEGAASLVRDKQAFREHWTKELDQWFEQGVDTPGLVLVQVTAKRIHYWEGMKEVELVPRGGTLAPDPS